MSQPKRHPDAEVNRALIALNDALCHWERTTGMQSVLIIREDSGWFHRSMSGKPVDAPVSDAQLWLAVEPPEEDP